MDRRDDLGLYSDSAATKLTMGTLRNLVQADDQPLNEELLDQLAGTYRVYAERSAAAAYWDWTFLSLPEGCTADEVFIACVSTATTMARRVSQLFPDEVAHPAATRALTMAIAWRLAEQRHGAVAMVRDAIYHAFTRQGCPADVT